MKSKKERSKFDSDRYRQIIAQNKTCVHRADIYEEMAPSIKRWIVDNIDYAAKAWFERIEQTVLRAQSSVEQTEFGFTLNPEAIIALGDSQRIRLGHCTRELCVARRTLIETNKTNQVQAADKEIGALNEAIAQLKPGQVIDDL